ncbi:MAG: transposase [Clostridiales Family XIII bacterium]|jgi:transposase-like protein|nr:transposase [Clostridiales Family XIII bacterium]
MKGAIIKILLSSFIVRTLIGLLPEDINELTKVINILSKWLLTLIIVLQLNLRTCELVEDSYMEVLEEKLQKLLHYGTYDTHYCSLYGSLLIPIPLIKSVDEEGKKTTVSFYLGRKKYNFIDDNIRIAIYLLYLGGLTPKLISTYLSPDGKKMKGLSERNIYNIIHKMHERFNFTTVFDPISQFIAIYLDATYTNVRSGKLCAIAAVGLTVDNKYQVLSIKSAKNGVEDESSYIEILEELKAKGINVPQIVIADRAPAIWSAVTKVFPDSTKQECLFHKFKKMFDLIDKSLWPEYGMKLREIFNANTKEEGLEKYDLIYEMSEKNKPLRKFLERNRDTIFAYFDFDIELKHKLYTSNPVETLFSILKPEAERSRGMMNEQNMMSIFHLLIQSFGSDKNIFEIIYDAVNDQRKEEFNVEKFFKDAIDIIKSFGPKEIIKDFLNLTKELALYLNEKFIEKQNNDDSCFKKIASNITSLLTFLFRKPRKSSKTDVNDEGEESLNPTLGRLDLGVKADEQNEENKNKSTIEKTVTTTTVKDDSLIEKNKTTINAEGNSTVEFKVESSIEVNISPSNKETSNTNIEDKNETTIDDENKQNNEDRNEPSIDDKNKPNIEDKNEITIEKISESRTRIKFNSQFTLKTKKPIKIKVQSITTKKHKQFVKQNQLPIEVKKTKILKNLPQKKNGGKPYLYNKKFRQKK